MFNSRTSKLFIVALILVSGIATTAYFKMAAPQKSSSLPAANPVVNNVAVAPVSVNPSVSHGTYMSEQTIRSILDQAYEQHRWGTREQTLLRILNGRYENRVGLPR